MDPHHHIMNIRIRFYFIVAKRVTRQCSVVLSGEGAFGSNGVKCVIEKRLNAPRRTLRSKPRAVRDLDRALEMSHLIRDARRRG